VAQKLGRRFRKHPFPLERFALPICFQLPAWSAGKKKPRARLWVGIGAGLDPGYAMLNVPAVLKPKSAAAIWFPAIVIQCVTVIPSFYTNVIRRSFTFNSSSRELKL
jgi:hypothetical protein